MRTVSRPRHHFSTFLAFHSFLHFRCTHERAWYPPIFRYQQFIDHKKHPAFFSYHTKKQKTQSLDVATLYTNLLFLGREHHFFLFCIHGPSQKEFWSIWAFCIQCCTRWIGTEWMVVYFLLHILNRLRGRLRSPPCSAFTILSAYLELIPICLWKWKWHLQTIRINHWLNWGAPHCGFCQCAHVVREICLLVFYMEPAVSVDIDFHGPREPDLGNPDLSQSEKDISPNPSNLSSDQFNAHFS